METEHVNDMDTQTLAAVESLQQLDESQGLIEPSNPELTEEELQEQEASAEFDEMTAAFTAQMGLGALEGSLKLLVHPRFEFSESAKKEALEKFAPLLVKYGVMLPEYIMKYQQEIEGVKAAFTLAKDGYSNVVKLRQEDYLTLSQTEQETEQETEVHDAA